MDNEMRMLLTLLLALTLAQAPELRVDLTTDAPRLAQWKILKSRAGSYGGTTFGPDGPKEQELFKVRAEVHSWTERAVEYSVILTNAAEKPIQVPVSMHSEQIPENRPIEFDSLFIGINSPDDEAIFNLFQLFGSEYLPGSYLTLQPQQALRFIVRSSPYRGEIRAGMRLQVRVKGTRISLTPAEGGVHEFTFFDPTRRAVSPVFHVN